MRFLHKRRRRNPKLTVSVVQKIARREKQLAKLRAQPRNYLTEILIEAKIAEMETIIRTAERIYDARMDQERRKVREKLAQPKPQDRRTREYREAKAKLAAQLQEQRLQDQAARMSSGIVPLPEGMMTPKDFGTSSGAHHVVLSIEDNDGKRIDPPVLVSVTASDPAPLAAMADDPTDGPGYHWGLVPESAP